jgi:hypothetical protein
MSSRYIAHVLEKQQAWGDTAIMTRRTDETDDEFVQRCVHYIYNLHPLTDSMIDQMSSMNTAYIHAILSAYNAVVQSLMETFIGMDEEVP